MVLVGRALAAISTARVLYTGNVLQLLSIAMWEMVPEMWAFGALLTRFVRLAAATNLQTNVMRHQPLQSV